MKPLTVFELGKHIGEKAIYLANGLSFLVTIENARANYNILEFLVKPVSGEGEMWIRASFVHYVKEDPA
jgi:hypothetical protein